MPDYDYEHLFIDNASTDGTVAILRELAAADKRVKVIVNTRNFGHVRSPYHAFLQARGDAVMSCVADLQDPPELIPEFVEKWRGGLQGRHRREEGQPRIPGSCPGRGGSTTGSSAGSRRTSSWSTTSPDSASTTAKSSSSSGAPTSSTHTSAVSSATSGTRRPRSTTSSRPGRSGKTKNNFFSLYDMAMLGITNHSKVPLRLATMAGFAISVISLLVAIGYLVAKLMFWDELQLGLAPLLIGIYFFGAVQLFFIGVLGEYIGSIHTQVHKRPLVVEKERINFDREIADDGSPVEQRVDSLR